MVRAKILRMLPLICKVSTYFHIYFTLMFNDFVSSNVFTDNLIWLSGVPNPPENVEVAEVYQTSCVVSWKTPQDDGGSPISKYIIERQVMFECFLFSNDIKTLVLLHLPNLLLGIRTYHSKLVGTMSLKYQLANHSNTKSKIWLPRKRTSSEYALLTKSDLVNQAYLPNQYWLKIHGVRI